MHANKFPLRIADGFFKLCVYVNTTQATTGATAMLLPAQNTHTLHSPTHRDTWSMRARGGVEDGLGVGGLDGGACRDLAAPECDLCTR